MTAPASEKQLRYLCALIEDREWADLVLPETLSEEEAGALIDTAKAMPIPLRPPAVAGFYAHHGKAYRVAVSKTTGHPYACVMEISGGALPVGRWKRAPWLVNRVTVRLSVAEAIRLGQASAVCHVCGMRLVNDDGIHFGCAAKLREHASA